MLIELRQEEMDRELRRLDSYLTTSGGGIGAKDNESDQDDDAIGHGGLKSAVVVKTEGMGEQKMEEEENEKKDEEEEWEGNKNGEQQQQQQQMEQQEAEENGGDRSGDEAITRGMGRNESICRIGMGRDESIIQIF